MGLRSLTQNLVNTAFTSLGDLTETAVFHRVGDDGEYDPSTGLVSNSTTDVPLPKVVVAGYAKSEIDGDVIRSTDQKVLIPYTDLNTRPETVDYITIEGEDWNVVSVGGVPAGSLWILQVRKT